MNRYITIDELHLTVCVPRTLSAREAAAIARTLRSASFKKVLKKAITCVFRDHPQLRGTRIALSR